MLDKIIIHTDGGARGNPGPAASAAVLENELGEILATPTFYLGVGTNNQAEYQGVIIALQEAKKINATAELDFFLDSELVVRQLIGEYKIKNQDLRKLWEEILNLSHGFKKISYQHIPREKNYQADKLVNEVLDREARK
jgi:ribonuclease HI